jgi:hypothetical protein
MVFVPPFDALATAISPDDLWNVFINGKVEKVPAVFRMLGQFDYVVFAGFRPIDMKTMACLDPVFTASGFAIYAVLAASLHVGQSADSPPCADRPKGWCP